MKQIPGSAGGLHVLNASEQRRDMKTKVEYPSASNGTKSIPTETQKETDLLYIIPSVVMSVPRANTALKRRDKTGGKELS
jgi:UDP-N-acetylenolpyruvoylglucosamine reductase